MSINKTSIKDQVYLVLKERILKQKYRLGEQLNPKIIAEKNDISIMPVRDALLRLSNEGLVVNKPRVGFFVKNFNAEEIKQVMEVRKMFELYCVKEHFDSIDRDEIHEINKIVELDAAELTRDRFDQEDISLHFCLIKASKNDFLIGEYNRIKDLFILFQHLNLERMKTAHIEHKKLVGAILENNLEKTINILKEHLEGVTLSIIRKIR